MSRPKSIPSQGQKVTFFPSTAQGSEMGLGHSSPMVHACCVPCSPQCRQLLLVSLGTQLTPASCWRPRKAPRWREFPPSNVLSQHLAVTPVSEVSRMRTSFCHLQRDGLKPAAQKNLALPGLKVGGWFPTTLILPPLSDPRIAAPTWSPSSPAALHSC